MASHLRSRYLFTPTIVSLPESICACRLAAASSIRIFGKPVSIARVIPPNFSTSSISVHAFVRQFRRQRFHVVTSAPGINNIADPRFFLQINLGVPGDAR